MPMAIRTYSVRVCLFHLTNRHFHLTLLATIFYLSVLPHIPADAGIDPLRQIFIYLRVKNELEKTHDFTQLRIKHF